jgi:uncharacterized protein YjbI with pentapeptide repeats
MDAVVHEIAAGHAGTETMTESAKSQISLLRGVCLGSRQERTRQAVVAGALAPPTGIARLWMTLSGSWSDRDGIIASKRLIRGIDVNEVAGLRGLWDRCHFESCHFRNCALAGLNLKSCRVVECTFSSCSLLGIGTSATPTELTIFDHCVFRKLRVRGAAIMGAVFKHCRFEESDVKDLQLMDCGSHQCSFTGSHGGVDLASSGVAGGEAEGINCVHECDFAGCSLLDVDLRGASTRGTIWPESGGSLRKSDR